MCVHLACCIIKAQKPAHREGREFRVGGGGADIECVEKTCFDGSCPIFGPKEKQ